MVCRVCSVWAALSPLALLPARPARRRQARAVEEVRSVWRVLVESAAACARRPHCAQTSSQPPSSPSPPSVGHAASASLEAPSHAFEWGNDPTSSKGLASMVVLLQALWVSVSAQASEAPSSSAARTLPLQLPQEIIHQTPHPNSLLVHQVRQIL